MIIFASIKAVCPRNFRERERVGGGAGWCVCVFLCACVCVYVCFWRDRKTAVEFMSCRISEIVIIQNNTELV